MTLSPDPHCVHVALSLSLYDRTHRKHCAGGVCDRAEKAVLDAVELYKRAGEVFNLSRIDCWDYPDPCLDYGAKKRYPFVAMCASCSLLSQPSCRSTASH
jgi:hypothetical protein